ncbi:MAG: methionine--tRNA ligase [bacterium]|nr:methionine--tRNA ligase [bacterium]
MSQSFYITTAISYVNAKPHIGHAYEFIASDAIARFKRMMGMKVFFLSGVDEHSAKVEKAAAAQGLPPREYCDQMSDVFRDVHARLGNQLDDFIRTSEPRHHAATKEMLRRSYENGDIYKAKYAGWYDLTAEAFVPETDLPEPDKRKNIEWIEEENYFFKLSNYTERLKEHFNAHPEFVQPDMYRNEMLALLDRGLQDISISRSTTRWGIPLPWDETHVSYVWFDALTNYLTGVGFVHDMAMYETFWPADAHIIGKDINRFHSVFWPAMLMSAGLPLPRQVFVHGFINHKGEKMSKSIGNVVDPLSLIENYGCDPLRYFLLREIAFGRDGDYSEDSLITRYNADLANDLGNLFSRVLSMIKKYRDCVVPNGAVDDSLRGVIDRVQTQYAEAMNQFMLHQALVAIWELVGRANQYVVENEPWALAKDEAKADRLDAVLFNLAEALRRTAIMVYPFMPSKAMEMLGDLGLPREGAPMLNQLDADACSGVTVTPGRSLFPRLEREEAK